MVKRCSHYVSQESYVELEISLLENGSEKDVRLNMVVTISLTKKSRKRL